MSIEGVASPFSPEVFSQAGEVRGGSSVQGSFMGHEVRVENSAESLLADAAEELGFAVDRTKDYELSERKVRDDSISKRTAELYRALMEKAGQSERMNELVDALKSAATRQAMTESLERLFSDASDAWSALDYAMEQLEKDGSVSRAQKELVRAFAEDYASQNAKSIRLGMQGALSGQGFPELGGTDETRGLYRQAVGEFSSVREVFTDIRGRFGDNFGRAMDFLFSAISEDIQSEVPSMGKPHLQSVMEKLGLVRLTQSAFLLCEDVVNRWTNVHQVRSGLTAMGLLGDAMDLRDAAYPSARDAQAIAAKSGAPDIERTVLFLQEFLAAFRRFPTGLFDDDARRMQALDAVQAALDEAIEEEDEFLSRQEEEEGGQTE